MARPKFFFPSRLEVLNDQGRFATAWLGFMRIVHKNLEGAVDLSTDVEGELPVNHGGTGATDATGAFDNLAPTTTEGDLIVRGAANNERLPIGDNHQVLQSDGTTAGWRFLDLQSPAFFGVLPPDKGGSGAIVQSISDTGTQDNYALDTEVTLLRCANPALLTLRGLAAGSDGQRLDIVSVGAGAVDLANQSTGSSGPNRILCGVTGPIRLEAGVGRARLVYDGTTNRWRVLTHEQGAATSPTFDAADFTGVGGTWTVASGNVDLRAFLLRGRQLIIMWSLRNTTVTGAPTTVRIALPSGLTPAAPASAMVDLRDNGAYAVGVAQVTTGGATVDIIRQDRAAFSASAGATDIDGSVTLEVL